MPTYTVKRAESEDDKEWDVNCSYSELKEMCDEYNLIHVLKPIKIVTGVGSLHSKVPDGFKDKLNQIKKGSGKGNTIKT